MSRGEDVEVNKGLTMTFKNFDEILKEAGDDKFLFGTDHPTMLDV